MNNETMTLHEALSQLKILDDRILSASTEIFITSNKNNNTKINGMNIEDFENCLKGNLQSAKDLIARRNTIKAALVAKNATVQLQIGKFNMSLAQAIDMKLFGINYKKTLLDNLKDQLGKILRHVETNNLKLETQADAYITQLYGSKEKADPKDIETAKESYIKPLTMNVIDPNQLQKQIKELESEIDEFNSKIDSAISVANAVNSIDIEY